MKGFNNRDLFGRPDRSKWLRWLTKFCWLGLLVFFILIVFNERGAVEYYSRVSELKSLENKMELLKTQNGQLIYELNQIQNNISYQRKVVRDYLGYLEKMSI